MYKMSALEKEVHNWKLPFCNSSSPSLFFFPIPVQHFYVFRSAGGGKHQAGVELLGYIVGGVVKISLRVWSERKHKRAFGGGQWCLEMWLLKSKTP